MVRAGPRWRAGQLTAIGIVFALVTLGAGCSGSSDSGVTAGPHKIQSTEPERAEPVGLRGTWDVTTSVTDAITDGDPVGSTIPDIWTIVDSCLSTQCGFTSALRKRDFGENTVQSISEFEGEYAANLKTAIECFGPDGEVLASLVGQQYDTYRFRPTQREGKVVTEMEGTIQSRIVADTFTCEMPDETGAGNVVLRRRPG